MILSVIIIVVLQLTGEIYVCACKGKLLTHHHASPQWGCGPFARPIRGSGAALSRRVVLSLSSSSSSVRGFYVILPSFVYKRGVWFEILCVVVRVMTQPKRARSGIRFAKAMKRMWREHRLTCVPPTRVLTPDDMAVNFGFVLDDAEHGDFDPATLLDRVRCGVKPMATILLREGGCIRLAERVLRKAATVMRLGFTVVAIGRDVWGVVYQPGVDTTLARFYDIDATISFYRGVRGASKLSRIYFRLPLETFAVNVVREDFDPGVRYPLLGMCFGYPLHETSALLADRVLLVGTV